MESVSFREALLVWLRIGFLSFGGPAGQIALMHKIIVEEKKWLDESRFLHALNYCMLLPGPEAQQLATYVGWLMHGVKGGLVAGTLFILPGASAIFILSYIYVTFNDLVFVDGLFFGLKAAVLALVVQALIRISKKSLKGKFQIYLAIFGFMALFFFAIPFPLVVLFGGILGYVKCKRQNKLAKDEIPKPVEVIIRSGTKKMAITCLVLWGVTLASLLLFLGKNNVFTDIGLFFSKLAIVTFGGAYAVLSYVAQQGVEHYQWLKPGEMLEGLGLAETTPGPLILVNQFVGFLAAYRNSGTEYNLFFAFLGGLLTLWVTFLPCFFWIFAGAPYIEKLRTNQAVSSALSAITAIVVGVIGNLALWFAINGLFENQEKFQRFGFNINYPVISSVNFYMILLSSISFVLLFRYKLPIHYLLGVIATLGVIASYIMMWLN